MKKILVVTHDAGGAEVIAAFVKRHAKKMQFRVYAAGPSVKVFKRLSLPTRLIKDTKASIHAAVEKNTDVDMALLPMPGWMTKIEIRALEEAKKAGLKAVVYIDSWIRYKERFGYAEKNWRQNLPDEFWAGDNYALKLAKKAYPKIPVRFVRNEYFEAIKKRYKILKKESPNKTKTPVILFLSAPELTSRDIFEELIAHLVHTSRHVLRVRFHPADDTKRYDKIIKQHKVVRVEKSTEKDIVRDIARARIVIGTETVAMVAAVLVGKKVISILPKRQKSYLPFPQITRVHRVEKVTTFL